MRLAAATVLLLAAINSLLAAPERQTLFTQVPEVAPSQEARVTQPAQPAAATPSDARHALSSGPEPRWIWSAGKGKSAGNNEICYLRTVFTGGSKEAWLKATCDNVMTIWLNGQQVAASSDWQSPVEVDVQKHIKTGSNELLVEAKNQGGIAGFLFKLALITPDGKPRYVVSDNAWEVAATKDAANWSKSKAIGRPGMAPWGDVFNKAATGPELAARDTFNLLPGFQVERLFTVPKETLGSWVAITTDNKGRLIASDQGNLGLCRITPPPIGGQEPTKVERLDVKISSAQGLLYAFDSLYVSVNGGPGSGLYRVKDTNGDDQFDEVVKLKEIRGGGEHGPHALRLSPDRQSILLVCGNHTRLPFEVKLNAAVQTMGGVRSEQHHAELPEGAASRMAPNWDEDLLLPRQWDGNGHATGILAPGGWIAKTDPEGKTWEIISSGYRNSYDFAINADGELFVYDADMEWDLGMPWYRPTRVTHATSGSEFGWRSGTGKWPAWYVDSLPTLVDIGPGSPVGVEFGYGTKFPARYQRALYLCDWTFGTMYAVHITPSGASYQAEKEEFLSRTPLPLTDAVVGHDGALYFTTGGRGTQSELFRATYVGKDSTAPVDAHDLQDATTRALRRQIEAYQVANTPDPGKAVEFLVPQLAHADRFIRYAARVALERIPVELWQDRVLNTGDAETVITGVVGLARQAEPALQPRLLEALGTVNFTSLSEPQQLELLRAYQLVLLRLGLPNESALATLGAQFEKLFPQGSAPVNRELVILMIGVSSPNAAHILTPILTRERVAAQQHLGDVLLRNRGYGGTVAAVLANQPDQFQMHVAFSLRNLKKGWTPEERKTYFSWFEKARTWSGGASYQKFLINIDKDAYENSTDIERLAVESIGLRKPFVVPALPKPRGPGRDYSLDELLAVSTTRMKGRDFANGKKMFAAARCVICHRFGGEGGSTGPDLTQAAGRFNFKDLTEATVDPSKVVSDQYRTTVLQTTEGRTYTGRVIALSDNTLTMLIDPEDPTKTVEVKKSEIEEQKLSPVSLMPKDLLKTLNEDEVLDLLAYLLSRGNPQDAMFRK